MCVLITYHKFNFYVIIKWSLMSENKIRLLLLRLLLPEAGLRHVAGSWPVSRQPAADRRPAARRRPACDRPAFGRQPAGGQLAPSQRPASGWPDSGRLRSAGRPAAGWQLAGQPYLILPVAAAEAVDWEFAYAALRFVLFWFPSHILKMT